MYFYTLKYDKTKQEYTQFRFSDSFLPLNSDSNHADKYKFSLFFPMGLTWGDPQTKTRVIITAGEGDYYSVMLQFQLQQVVNLCTYDISNLSEGNINGYDYFLLSYNGKTTEIVHVGDYQTCSPQNLDVVSYDYLLYTDLYQETK